MDDESKFCTGCGANVEPGMQFCPKCGKVVSGSEADADMKENMEEMMKIATEMRRTWLLFLLFVYAIPVTIAGIISLADASAVTDAIWSNQSFQSWMASHSYTWTHGDIQNYVTYASALTLVSGVCALLSGILVYKKKLWIGAVVLCLLAAIFCFWSIFGMLIGFLVTWMLVDAKPLFED